MCANTHRLPWSVNPPAALKFSRTNNAWKQYKEFRVAYGRHSDFATRTLVELEINYRLHHLSPAAEQAMSRT